MATRRTQIVNALVDVIKQIDGQSPYTSRLYENVEGKLKFWDEVQETPFVCLTAGNETREYLPGNFSWGFLDILIRIYVTSDNSKEELEEIFEDIEYVIDANNELVFGDGPDETCTDIRIFNIVDDEGVLHPTSVGEINLQVQYPIQRSN